MAEKAREAKKRNKEKEEEIPCGKDAVCESEDEAYQNWEPKTEYVGSA